MLMSHLGRPVEGEYDEQYSLAPVAEHLAGLIDKPVALIKDWLEADIKLDDGDLVMLENVRFNLGEKKDDARLAQQMAALCDVYVMDAFGTAHRAQASTHGVAKYAATACAGPLLCAELDALGQALDQPQAPMVAIVGGSKVSTKLEVLNALSTKVERLIVGGGIANTFLAAAGLPVGKSLCEQELIPLAKELMSKTEIPLPTDVVVAKDTPVKATANGIVIFAEWTASTGHVIIIEHSYGLISIYKHNASLTKSQGDLVKAGEVIATAGNSGELSTGTHLHFELWNDGYPINPTNFIDFK